jgi:hypothetical protein
MLVVGLLMRMQAFTTPPPILLTGPALLAAVAARIHGAQPHIVAGLPLDLQPDDGALLEAVDPGLPFARPVPRPGLKWQGPAILGESGEAKLIGSPEVWRVAVSPAVGEGQDLVFANGDPEWHAAVLQRCRPRFVAMDIHGDWIPHRAAALDACLRRSNLVTITERDLARLPPTLRVELEQPQGPAVVIKRGAKGVTIMAGGERSDLRAPDLQGAIRQDIGAGDLLLGALAASLTRVDGPVPLAGLCNAYVEVRPLIARLITSGGHRDFLAGVVQWTT